jgi:hypothetical protein
MMLLEVLQKEYFLTSTDAEDTNAAGLTAFDSDGFTVGIQVQS